MDTRSTQCPSFIDWSGALRSLRMVVGHYQPLADNDAPDRLMRAPSDQTCLLQPSQKTKKKRLTVNPLFFAPLLLGYESRATTNGVAARVLQVLLS
jgi:hypothetical protein